MILVDTSVWIDHFRRSNARLVDLLRENRVFIHPMVIGELACGSLRQRNEILPLLQLLPWAELLSHDEVLHFIEKRKLFGQGVGWVDVNLLASCLLSGAALWTNDKNLRKIAQIFNLNDETSR
jgi:predicted nucleic acid-binding protein